MPLPAMKFLGNTCLNEVRGLQHGEMCTGNPSPNSPAHRGVGRPRHGQGASERKEGLAFGSMDTDWKKDFIRPGLLHCPFKIPAASRYESLLFPLPRCIQLCLTPSSWRGVLARASRKGAEHLYPSVAKRDLRQVSLWWTASSSKLETGNAATGMTFPISIYWNLKNVVSLFPFACPLDSHLSAAELF